MFRLFKSSGSNDAQQQAARSYTRFEQESDPKPSLDDQEPLTRFSPPAPSQQAPQAQAPLPPRVERPQSKPQRVRSTAPQNSVHAPKPRINENAHLHASNQIPMWVFEKALPQRFADMSESNDEFVFQ